MDPKDQIALFDLDGTAIPVSDNNHAAPTEAHPQANTSEDAPGVPDPAVKPEISPTESSVEDDVADASAAKPWEKLPVGEEADGHAIVLTADATYTPSGQHLTGPVDSIEKLGKLIKWAALTPLGTPAQVWVVGIDACAQLGWTIDPGSEDDVDDLEQLRLRAAEELCQVINSTLLPLTNDGWELRGDPGHVVHLARMIGKATQMVDVIIEPYVWTYWNKDFGWGNRIGDMGILGSPAAHTYLPDEDLPAARELGRRLAWSARHLGVLPGPTPARTGAAMLDKIRRERTRTSKGIVIDTAGPVPPIDGPPRGDLEPPAGWARIPDSDDLDGVSTLVTIDQRAAYLASAGMLNLGYGKPQYLRGEPAAREAAKDKPPFGLWRVTLPAAAQYSLPDKLPLPHPAMQLDQSVQTWVTTVSLDGLCTPIVDGGMGLSIDDLDVVEAWVYPSQTRALEKWGATLRAARAAAVSTNDQAMKRFVGACYKGYIGRMVNPDMWTATRMQHHHQPLWRAAIIAHCRWRGRRVAMRIARETGRWPIRTATDSWVYLLGPDQSIEDDSQALGKMVLEKRAELDDDLLAVFAALRDTHELKMAIAAAYDSDIDESEEA